MYSEYWLRPLNLNGYLSPINLNQTFVEIFCCEMPRKSLLLISLYKHQHNSLLHSQFPFHLLHLEFFFSDSGNEVRVSLWGQKASAFNIDNLNDSSGPSPTTILLIGCLVKTFQGMLVIHVHIAYSTELKSLTSSCISTNKSVAYFCFRPTLSERPLCLSLVYKSWNSRIWDSTPKVRLH